jgi:hypothetical protein
LVCGKWALRAGKGSGIAARQVEMLNNPSLLANHRHLNLKLKANPSSSCHQNISQ